MIDNVLLPALARFESSLNEAFSTPLTAETTIEDKRARYILSLVAVGDLLHDIGKVDQGHEFAELASALEDLNIGVVRDFFEKGGEANRPHSPSDVWRNRAIVCIGLELLEQSGLSGRRSSEFVQKHYPSLQALASKKAKSLQTVVLYWRSRFQNNSVSNHAAQKIYSQHLDSLKAHSSRRTSEQKMQLARAYLNVAAEGASRVKPL